MAYKFNKIIWYPHCLLKQRLYFWLVIQNRILTEGNLMKRGYHGPSRCIMCKGVEELVSHLFILCPFSRTIWSQLLYELNCHLKWEGSSVEDVVAVWFSISDKKLKTIPVRIFWGIWIHHNKTIFEGIQVNSQVVIYKIKATIEEQKPLFSI